MAKNLTQRNRWVVGLATLWVFAIAIGAGIPACVGDPPAVTSQEGGTCNAPLTSCGGTCVETTVDPGNCGKCGTVCASGQVCSNGACSASCASGTNACPVGTGTGCVDEQSDNQNCGACGMACPAGEVCSAGKCAVGCASGLTTCSVAGGAFCANTTNDSNNCGTCGNACGSGFDCVSSVCVEGCATGLLLCPAFAGYDAGGPEAGPDGGDASADGASADGGTEDAATDGATVDAAPVDASPPPMTCVDPNRDDRNCGACGNVCAADQSCTGGACTYAASCSDLLNRKGPLVDGVYTIQPIRPPPAPSASDGGADGSAEGGSVDAGSADAGPPIKPFAVYCHGMDTPNPGEYLTLAHSALTNEPTSNYTMAASGGGCGSACLTPSSDGGGGDDYSQFTRVRLLVPSLVVDVTDRTFVFSRNPAIDACWLALGGGCTHLWELPYGTAGDCVCELQGNPGGPGMANIDLRDTGFSIDPSVRYGYTNPSSSPYGGVTSVDPQHVINVSGGGCCGGEGPATPFLLDQE